MSARSRHRSRRRQWARVLRAQAMLAHDPDTPAYAKLRARLARVRGVLLYQMDQQFAARLWSEHKELRSIDLALARAQRALDPSRRRAAGAAGRRPAISRDG